MFSKEQGKSELLLLENDLLRFLEDKGLVSCPGVQSELLTQARQASYLKPMALALQSGGKRMRPLLVYRTFRAEALQRAAETEVAPSNIHSLLAESESATMRKVAVAVEVLHCASLVIDDIEDGSSTRRGKASLHMQVGVPKALNTASMMYFAAINHLPEGPLRSVALSTLEACHVGQALDLAASSPELVHEAFHASHEDRMKLYREVAMEKTSRLIEFGARATALALSMSDERTQRLSHAFEEFGLAFQILDDLKNLNPNLSGEKTYEDLSSGLRNIVCVYVLDELSHHRRFEAYEHYLAGTLKSFLLTSPAFALATEKAEAAARESLNTGFAALHEVFPSTIACRQIAEPFESYASSILNVGTKKKPLRTQSGAI